MYRDTYRFEHKLDIVLNIGYFLISYVEIIIIFKW